MASITIMPSIDFQRICRDMHNLATDVEITRRDKHFIIQCYGDFANQQTSIECNDDFKGCELVTEGYLRPVANSHLSPQVPFRTVLFEVFEPLHQSHWDVFISEHHAGATTTFDNESVRVRSQTR